MYCYAKIIVVIPCTACAYAASHWHVINFQSKENQQQRCSVPFIWCLCYKRTHIHTQAHGHVIAITLGLPLIVTTWVIACGSQIDCVYVLLETFQTASTLIVNNYLEERFLSRVFLLLFQAIDERFFFFIRWQRTLSFWDTVILLEVQQCSGLLVLSNYSVGFPRNIVILMSSFGLFHLNPPRLNCKKKRKALISQRVGEKVSLTSTSTCSSV